MKVFRPNLSEYFESDFRKKEKAKIESIAGVSYVQSWEESPQILLTNTSTNLVHKNVQNVRLIIHPNSGHEPFKKTFVENFPGVIVMGNIIRTQAVVQYTLSCLFQRYCQPPFSRQWDYHRRWHRPLFKDMNVLIVGYGNIGKKIASVLNSLDVNPQIYDPWQGHERINPDHADAIILCCSSNPLNKHFVNTTFLNRLPSHVTIINPARGNLIDETALYKFLKNNPNAFAFLDVHECEPFTHKKTHQLPNMATTSHVAGVFKNIEQNIIDFEYNVIKNFVSSAQSFRSNHQSSLLTPSSFVAPPFSDLQSRL